jgi:ABC-type microcin C transport system duplicated ATPase subunit YejF
MRSVVHKVDLCVPEGASLALVGESGAGKSMTLRAILRMLPTAAEVAGTISFDGADVGTFDAARLRKYRGSDVGVIFQNARAHINPVRRLGDFLTEGLVRTRGVNTAEARTKV